MLINWSNISSDTFWGKLLRLPLRFIPKSTVVTVFSGLNRGMKWIVGSSTHGCWLGTYEFTKQSVISCFIKPGMRVFDIGANAGFYTIAFSRLVGKQGHVWAFEPLAENSNNILRHVYLNKLQNITLLQIAVTDQNGIVGFQVANSNSMGAVSEGTDRYKVPAMSLDNLITKGTIPIPDMIKIDVEGAESLVLKGAKELMKKKKTILFISLHGDKQKQQCLELLKSNGYDIYTLNGNKVSNENILSDEIYVLPNKAIISQYKL